MIIKKNNFSKCYNRKIDICSSKFKTSNRSQNIYKWENGSINFLNFYFAVRRIITLLFAIIKVQFNTWRFAKILSKVFVPFIYDEKNTVDCIRSSVVEHLTSDQQVESSSPYRVLIFNCNFFGLL